MRISVAMATYEGGRWIRAQLDSLLDQTRRPDQLVVSDDCSTDDTRLITEQFARTAPFEVLRLQNESTLGYSRNFERALSACDGDLVFLCDQDDVWLPGKIETVERTIAETGRKLLVHDQVVVDDGLVVHPPSMIERLALLGESDRQHIKGCATAVDRSLLDVGLPVIGSHDKWLHDIAAALGERHVLREQLALYRVHGSNTSRHELNRLPAPTLLQRLRRRARKALFELVRSEESLRQEIRAREAVLCRAERIRPGTDADGSREALRSLRARLDRREQSSARRRAARSVRRAGSWVR